MTNCMRRYVWRSNILQPMQYDHIANENDEPGDFNSGSRPRSMLLKYLPSVRPKTPNRLKINWICPDWWCEDGDWSSCFTNYKAG